MFIRPGVVEVEGLRVPHSPLRGVVGDVHQVVAVVVDVAWGGGRREEGGGERERR